MNNKNREENIILFQQHAFENKQSEYQVDEEKSINIHADILNKLSEAKIVGTFTPTSPGEKLLTALFTYNEGEEVPVELKLTVVQVQLTAEIIKGLPNTVVKNSEHPIEFLIKNTDLTDAILMGFNHGSLIEGSIVISEEAIDGISEVITYSFAEFQEKLTTGLKLDSHKQYRVKATYKVIDENNKNDILFKYKESDTLENESDREGVRIRLLENINIEKEATVKVIGKASAQNLNFKMGEKEKIEFIFTNMSSDFPATGVNITIIKKVDGKAATVKKN